MNLQDVETILEQAMNLQRQRISRALEMAEMGAADGADHKMWAIDQMVRALTGCQMKTVTAIDCEGDPYTFETMGENAEYCEWVRTYQQGEDGPLTYEWDTGIAP